MLGAETVLVVNWSISIQTRMIAEARSPRLREIVSAVLRDAVRFITHSHSESDLQLIVTLVLLVVTVNRAELAVMCGE